ncbi:MAG: endolytic transglycosylase MltG [Firmicutes bacterium]|nr:endolytic transglycosylase MltG [Bacillota bacterium]
MEENRTPIQPEDENRIYSGREEPESSLGDLEAELKAKREKKIENFKVDISEFEPSEDDVDFFADAAGQEPSAASAEELYSCSQEFRRQKEQQSGEQTARPKKKKKLRRKKKNGCLNRIIYFSVIGLIAIALSQIIISGAYDLLGVNRPEKEAVIEITPETTDDEVVDQLVEAGAVRQRWFYQIYAKLTKASYVPGSYTIQTDMDYEALINALHNTSNRTDIVTLTFTEGETVQQIAAKLEAANVCSAEDFIATVNEYEISAGNKLVQAIPNAEQRAYRLEGYLFPDTYDFYLYENPKTTLRRFLNNIYTQRITAEMYERAENLGMTMDQVLILASMVQKEAGTKEDMYLISSVFHNRLKASATYPKLQSDPTKYYEQALGSKYAGTYDTYVCDGLPVGPICNPGLDAINAVLYPKTTKYYYFVADVNGKTYYASTLAQHEQNIAKAKAVQPVSSQAASSEEAAQ